jgi:hypothetical protein
LIFEIKEALSPQNIFPFFKKINITINTNVFYPNKGVFTTL